MTQAQMVLDAAIRTAMREHPGMDYLASAHYAWLSEISGGPPTRKPSRDELVGAGWLPPARQSDPGPSIGSVVIGAGLGGAVAGAIIGVSYGASECPTPDTGSTCGAGE